MLQSSRSHALRGNAAGTLRVRPVKNRNICFRVLVPTLCVGMQPGRSASARLKTENTFRAFVLQKKEENEKIYRNYRVYPVFCCQRGGSC
jgi:hypothetical protein